MRQVVFDVVFSILKIGFLEIFPFFPIMTGSYQLKFKFQYFIIKNQGQSDDKW